MEPLNCSDINGLLTEAKRDLVSDIKPIEIKLTCKTIKCERKILTWKHFIGPVSKFLPWWLANFLFYRLKFKFKFEEKPVLWSKGPTIFLMSKACYDEQQQLILAEQAGKENHNG